MVFEYKQSYYDVLEIHPDASVQEIREAYLRLKSTYAKDNVAHYTMFSKDQTLDLLDEIEKAYQVLSNPESRKHYDFNHDHSHGSPAQNDFGRASRNPFTETKRSGQAATVVSIDRVPPMDSSSDDLLISPETDYQKRPTASQPSANVPHPNPTPREPLELAGQTLKEIDEEMEWRGNAIKKFREAQNISIEELSEFTKISKTYLRAIEDEMFEKLPAAVFLRGFLMTLAKKLKLPQDRLLSAYLTRFKETNPKDKRT